jgi:hypothetical protein
MTQPQIELEKLRALPNSPPSNGQCRHEIGPIVGGYTTAKPIRD